MSDLMQLLLIWVAVLGAGFLAQKTKLTSVLYFLAFGALFVNIGLMPEHPSPFMTTFAELGIITIMFALGFEENAGHFVSGMKRAWGIAFFGAIVPFGIAYAVTFSIWESSSVSIICGLTMTATAVSLTMVSLKTEGLIPSPVATGIMTAAVIDDIASLALIAILVPMAQGQASFDLLNIAILLVKAAMFFVIVVFIAICIFPHYNVPKFLRWIPYIDRIGIRHLLILGKGQHTTLILLVLAVSSGLLSEWFNFHPAVGAYMAGLILREEYFEDTGTSYYQGTKAIIDNVAFSWIGPVFFVVLGSHIHLNMELVVDVLPYTLLLTFGILIGQVSSASIAARYTGNYDWPSSMMIGIGMLGRAELAFVVLNIGYVQTKILSEHAFYTLMFTAFLLNLMVPLGIKWWKPRLVDAHKEDDGIVPPPPTSDEHGNPLTK